MKFFEGALLAFAVASGAGLAERIADPLERHAHDYVLEGPAPPSEAFYLSSNWYDESGKKHNDRVGDGLLAASLLLGTSSLLIRFESGSNAQIQKDPHTADPSVT